MYVVDFYRKIIEHPEWLPKELKNSPDLLAGKERGGFGGSSRTATRRQWFDHSSETSRRPNWSLFWSIPSRGIGRLPNDCCSSDRIRADEEPLRSARARLAATRRAIARGMAA